MSSDKYDMAVEGLASETDAGTYRRRIDSFLRLYAVRRSPGLIPGLHLSVPVPSSFTEAEMLGSDRFHLNVSVDDSSTEISLYAADEESHEIFHTVARDLSAHILDAEDAATAAATFVRRFGKWKQALKGERSCLMSEQSCLGLFGELSTLKELVVPALGIAEAVDSWTGPEEEPQDFQAKGIAIEVKSIVHSKPQTFLIQGERQLDDFALDALVLVHHRMFRKKGSGQTLPELVADLREELAPLPATQAIFDDKLLAYGYVDEVANRNYTTIGYTASVTNLYRVHDGFPRITESDLSRGIGSLKYSIVSDVCERFRIQESEVSGWLKEPELIAVSGRDLESRAVEYKQSAWTAIDETHNDGHRQEVERSLQSSIIRTVAAFMNTDGGELVIGVRDSDRKVTGIECDLESAGLSGDDFDSYELRLMTLLMNNIDKLVHREVRVQFKCDNGVTACHVLVAPSPNPRFGKPLAKSNNEGRPMFWVRAGNQTNALEGTEMLDYVSQHWHTG